MKGSHFFVFFIYLPLLVVSLAIWTNATSSTPQHSHSQPQHQEHFEDGEPSDKHLEETDDVYDDYNYDNYEAISDEELEEARRKFIESWEGFGIEEMEPDGSPHSDDQSDGDVINHGHDLDTSSMESTKKEEKSHK
ncbi:hypothetical protein TSMEX_008287 [Taenia solium]|eukprot:TsM_000051100 transcript=TsM_000051100 gene=TsM_000051100